MERKSEWRRPATFTEGWQNTNWLSFPTWCDLEIHYSPATAGEQMKAWLGKDLAYFAQVDGNLGDRLRLAARNVFEREVGAILFLGGDCPDVTTPVLEKAAAHLESHDVVLGPATDGGYYLIAMKHYYPRLFDQIDWSTDRVLAQPKERIEELGLRSSLLTPHSDVDDLASLRLAQKTHASHAVVTVILLALAAFVIFARGFKAPVAS